MGGGTGAGASDAETLEVAAGEGLAMIGVPPSSAPRPRPKAGFAMSAECRSPAGQSRKSNGQGLKLADAKAQRSRNQIPSEGFTAEVAEVFAKVAKPFASAFLCEDLCVVRVEKSPQDAKFGDRNAAEIPGASPRTKRCGRATARAPDGLDFRLPTPDLRFLA